MQFSADAVVCVDVVYYEAAVVWQVGGIMLPQSMQFSAVAVVCVDVVYYEAAVVWQVGGIMLCGAVVGFDEKVATLQLLLFLLKST